MACILKQYCILLSRVISMDESTWSHDAQRDGATKSVAWLCGRLCGKQIVLEQWKVPPPHYCFPLHSPLMHDRMPSLGQGLPSTVLRKWKHWYNCLCKKNGIKSNCLITTKCMCPSLPLFHLSTGPKVLQLCPHLDYLWLIKERNEGLWQFLQIPFHNLVTHEYMLISNWNRAAGHILHSVFKYFILHTKYSEE